MSAGVHQIAARLYVFDGSTSMCQLPVSSDLTAKEA